jgi:hypothetical protein
MEETPAKIGIYERGMWIGMSAIDDQEQLNIHRKHLDEDAQMEAPLYGLGPLTFFEERITTEGNLLWPRFFALLRRYKGAVIGPGKKQLRTGPNLIP